MDSETENYSYGTCGAVGEDRTALVWILGVTFGALGLVAFGLRCVARLHMGAQSWGMDDWVMCLAVVSGPWTSWSFSMLTGRQGFMIPLCVISVPRKSAVEVPLNRTRLT